MPASKVAIGAALILVVVAGVVSPARAASDYPSGRFVDDDRHPAEVALAWLGQRGVIDGCNPPGNSRSCPDDPVNRAEAAKIIVELGAVSGHLPASPSVPPDRFVDDAGALGGGGGRYLDLLASIGALHGCDPPQNTRVCPQAGITRGEAAKILVAAFGLEGPGTHAAPWSDLGGRFYEEAARVASFHGMWTERSSFDGSERLTRAELAMAAVAASGNRLCPPDPFTHARVDELDDRYPNQSITAHVYDTRTGCHYRLNPENRQRTASVFKVMVMAGTLLEAQEEGRDVSDWELSQLDPMITESANGPVRALWWAYGASPWFSRQVDIFGLGDTTAIGDDGSARGLTTTSAADQVDLLRQTLLTEWGPLDGTQVGVAVELMTSVVASQTWGVTAGVPDGWVVAQKNGFAGITINSVGWVDEPGTSNGYLVAILSQGWPDHPSGIEAVERVNRWVASALAK